LEEGSGGGEVGGSDCGVTGGDCVGTDGDEFGGGDDVVGGGANGTTGGGADGTTGGGDCVVEFEESGDSTLGCGGVEVALEAGGTAEGDEFGDGDVVAIYFENAGMEII
jgi:hypothetical protein